MYPLGEEQRRSIASFNMDLANMAMEDPQRAQDALEIMEQLYQQDPDNPMYVQPDSASYTTVIEGWCCGNPIFPSTNDDKITDATTTTTTSSSSSSSSSNTSIIQNHGIMESDVSAAAARQAQALLDKMEDECTISGRLCPNEITYLLVCQKWAESYKYDATGIHAERAHAILNHIKTKNLPTTIIPTVQMYSIVLEGWCRRVGRVRHAMDRAEQLLQEMEDYCSKQTTANQRTDRKKIRPNIVTYTSVIGGLARSKEPNLATRAEQLLTRMMQNQGIEPDMVVYTSVLNCWARATSRKEREMAADRAMEILKHMEDLYIKEEKYYVKPNAITYGTAIKAIGNSLNPNAPALAEQVLNRMYTLTESGLIHVPPTTNNYNAVITSLSTSGARNQKVANARRAEQLLVEMIRRARSNEPGVEPNVRTLGAVLRAWAECGQPDSGEQAQRVLDQLEEWYAEGKTAVRPNVVCYTTVMNAWVRGSAPPKVALDSVEKILRKMEDEYEETLDPHVRPNKISYVTAIDAFCRKSKDNAASHAQAIVDRMMRLYAKGLGHDRPTRIVFNALINAWSRSNDPNAASNAEKIFRWMEAQYRGGDDSVKPDELTLSGVLNAWANHATDAGALRAQQILDHVESLPPEERGFARSIVCHNVVIKAWGRSRAADAVQRAEAILVRLENEYQNGSTNIRPDVTTYSSVINCCAYYSGKETGRKAALDVAMRTFQKIRQTGEGANHITYGTLFKAIAKLAPSNKNRDELIKKYFLQCRDEGQVDQFVLAQVKAAISSSLFLDLVLAPSNLSEDEDNIERILSAMPREWGRNVTN